MLVALAWPNHTHHEQARTWFARNHREGWATTPFTEAGFVRVSSNRAAIAAATTPQIALTLLAELTALAGHHFWADEVERVVGRGIPTQLITTHRDVTDAHLLALAGQHGGRLVTFDARIVRLQGSADPELLEVWG